MPLTTHSPLSSVVVAVVDKKWIGQTVAGLVLAESAARVRRTKIRLRASSPAAAHFPPVAHFRRPHIERKLRFYRIRHTADRGWLQRSQYIFSQRKSAVAFCERASAHFRSANAHSIVAADFTADHILVCFIERAVISFSWKYW